MSSCSNGYYEQDNLGFYKVEVKSYPNKIIYIQNKDMVLDLTGLAYWRFPKNEISGNKELIEYTDWIVDENNDEFHSSHRIDTDIDFTKEGIYEVSVFVLLYNDGYNKIPVEKGKITYTVQVISEENLQKLLEE